MQRLTRPVFIPDKSQAVSLNKLLAAVRGSFLDPDPTDILVELEDPADRSRLILVLACGLVQLLPADIKRVATGLKVVQVST